MPGYWNGLEYNNQKLPGNGYGTYYLKVLLPPKSEDVAIRTQMLSTAYQLFMNGELIILNGQVGKSSENSIPDMIPASHYYVPKSDILHIVLHVSNFHHKKGGASRELILGTASNIKRYDTFALALNLLFSGSIFMMGLYHLGFYFNRKNDKSPFYLSLFCFVIAVRDIVSNEIFLKQVFPNIPWEMIEKLRYLTFYICVPIFTYFLEIVFTKYFPKIFLKFDRWIGFTTSLLVLFTPASIYTHSVLYFEIFTIIVISFSLYIIFLAARNGQKGAVLFLIGFSVLFATAINDILVHEGITTVSKDLTPFGLLFFIMMQALMLSRRFAQALSDIETLSSRLEAKSVELEDNNVKLKDFGERMEILVKKRTALFKIP